MTEIALSTSIYRAFAGMDRRFELRIGEIKELEQICGAGIGEIYTRTTMLRFKLEDLRQTVRLGLVGGGMPAADATALVMAVTAGRPLTDLHGLALDVLRALFVGVDASGNFHLPATAENRDAPETSPASTRPAPPAASTREPSIQ